MRYEQTTRVVTVFFSALIGFGLKHLLDVDSKGGEMYGNRWVLLVLCVLLFLRFLLGSANHLSAEYAARYQVPKISLILDLLFLAGFGILASRICYSTTIRDFLFWALVLPGAALAWSTANRLFPRRFKNTGTAQLWAKGWMPINLFQFGSIGIAYLLSTRPGISTAVVTRYLTILIPVFAILLVWDISHQLTVLSRVGGHESQDEMDNSKPPTGERAGTRAGATRWTDHWTVIFTGGIFVATVAYVIVSNFQLSATRVQLLTMKGQLSTMTQQLHAAERPWLVFRSARDLKMRKGQLPADVAIFLFNSGRGPALNVEARVAGFGIKLEQVVPKAGGGQQATRLRVPLGSVRLPPAEVVKRLGPWQNVGSIVAGGLEREVNVPMDTTTLEKVADVLDGRAHLFIAAEVQYRDQFRQQHRSGVCMLYVPKTTGWMLCDDHVAAD